MLMRFSLTVSVATIHPALLFLTPTIFLFIYYFRLYFYAIWIFLTFSTFNKGEREIQIEKYLFIYLILQLFIYLLNFNNIFI